jgi:hypothetical protein
MGCRGRSRVAQLLLSSPIDELAGRGQRAPNEHRDYRRRSRMVLPWLQEARPVFAGRVVPAEVGEKYRSIGAS